MTARTPTRRNLLIGCTSGIAGVLAGCASGSTSHQERTEPATDREAPRETDEGASPTEEVVTGSSDDLVLPSLDVAGSPGGLVALRPEGKVALLNFFATWCPPCETEMKNLRAVRARFDREAVSIVSITQETDKAAIKTFWRDNQGTWPVVMDPSIRAAREFDTPTIPTIIVLATDGTEMARHTGLVGEQPIADAIDTALDRTGGA